MSAPRAQMYLGRRERAKPILGDETAVDVFNELVSRRRPTSKVKAPIRVQGRTATSRVRPISTSW